MATLTARSFECQLYVPAHGPMVFRLPAEAGPKRVATLMPLDYTALTDPGFRRLIAVFQSLPQAL